MVSDGFACFRIVSGGFGWFAVLVVMERFTFQTIQMNTS